MFRIPTKRYLSAYIRRIDVCYGLTPLLSAANSLTKRGSLTAARAVFGPGLIPAPPRGTILFSLGATDQLLALLDPTMSSQPLQSSSRNDRYVSPIWQAAIDKYY